LKVDFELLKEGYFDALGWNIKSGKPEHQILESLWLDKLTADL
jgi:hypothetical protein